MSAAGLAPGTRVQLTGDSLTEWGRDAAAPATLGHGYVGMLAAGPLAGLPVRNTGVGGDRVRDLAARWERDVLAVETDLLSVGVGINDTWRFVDQGEHTPAEDVETGLRALLEPLRQRGTALVLIEPFVLPVTPDQERWDEDLAPKQRAVRSVAAALGAAFVATAEPFRAAALTTDARDLVADGVHPTERGHRLLADLWWTTVHAAVGAR